MKINLIISAARLTQSQEEVFEKLGDFKTIDTEVRSFDTVIENIQKFLNGKPQNLVSYK